MGWLETLKNLLSVLAYFFNPKARRRREKERLLNKALALEDAYGIAMEANEPEIMARIDAQMEELRERIIYLESKE